MIYSNSEMCHAINEYVHDSKYRELLRLRFCDGLTYEQIAEEVNYSPQHVKHVCRCYKTLLLSQI
jgi:AraC-like DNA-binding protein